VSYVTSSILTPLLLGDLPEKTQASLVTATSLLAALPTFTQEAVFANQATELRFSLVSGSIQEVKKICEFLEAADQVDMLGYTSYELEKYFPGIAPSAEFWEYYDKEIRATAVSIELELTRLPESRLTQLLTSAELEAFRTRLRPTVLVPTAAREEEFIYHGDVLQPQMESGKVDLQVATEAVRLTRRRMTANLEHLSTPSYKPSWRNSTPGDWSLPDEILSAARHSMEEVSEQLNNLRDNTTTNLAARDRLSLEDLVKSTVDMVTTIDPQAGNLLLEIASSGRVVSISSAAEIKTWHGMFIGHGNYGYTFLPHEPDLEDYFIPGHELGHALVDAYSILPGSAGRVPLDTHEVLASAFEWLTLDSLPISSLARMDLESFHLIDAYAANAASAWADDILGFEEHAITTDSLMQTTADTYTRFYSTYVNDAETVASMLARLSLSPKTADYGVVAFILGHAFAERPESLVQALTLAPRLTLPELIEEVDIPARTYDEMKKLATSVVRETLDKLSAARGQAVEAKGESVRKVTLLTSPKVQETQAPLTH
jgi:hypothetical protein